jgi:hypothetical protein
VKNIFLFIILSFTCVINCYSQNWLWSRSGDGIGDNVSHSVCTDSKGELYVTGGFSDSITFGSITLTNAGYYDIFITKYDTAGNVLWAKNAGGTNDDEGFSVSTDSSDNVYLTGYFSSSLITFDSITLTNSGGSNVFIAKYDTNGNILWAKSSGGLGVDDGVSCSADIYGNVFVTGWFYSSITFDSTTLINSGINDAFIVKYDTNGNVLWAKSATGAHDDGGLSVSTDASGNVFFTGIFYSPTITFGSITLTNAGGYDVFIAKYDANGNVLWAKRAGGTGWDEGYSVKADASGNVFVAGYFSSSSISFTNTTLTNAGGYDAFIAKYDANGNVLWAKSAGGINNDVAIAVSVDAGKNIFAIGYFSSPTVIFGSDILTQPVGSSNPMFIVKYDYYGNVLCTSALASGGYIVNSISGGYINNGLVIDPYGNAYVAAEFNVNPFIVGTDSLLQTGSENVFVAKYKCDNYDVMTLVNEQRNEGMMSVFPNPTSGIFKVNFRNKTVETKICIYDMLGNCVIDIVSMKNSNMEIDLSKQSKGIYFIEIVSDYERVVNKIVLQ